MPDELRMKGPYRYDDWYAHILDGENQVVVEVRAEADHPRAAVLIGDARGHWIAEAMNRYEQEQTNNV